MDAKVLEVTNASVSLHGGNIKIDAEGKVNSTGWSNARFVPYIYIVAPPDGIYDFDLVATAPTGIVQWTISIVKASLEMPAIPQMKGVRIHGANGAVEALLPRGIVPAGEGLPLPWPFPWMTQPKTE